MRRLLVMRHAAAGAGADDHERPLSAAGRAQAAAVGRALVARGSPGLVLCSSARRAVETAETLCGALEANPRCEIERALYLAAPAGMLARLAQVPEGERSVLLVGHNPGMGELARSLAREGADELLAGLRRGFPTGALAELVLPAASWAEAGLGGRLEALLLPPTQV